MTRLAARYGFAVSVIVAAALLRALLGSVLDLERSPFLFFTPSVFLAAAVGGLGPGLLATALGRTSAVAAAEPVSPAPTFAPDDAGFRERVVPGGGIKQLFVPDPEGVLVEINFR